MESGVNIEAVDGAGHPACGVEIRPPMLHRLGRLFKQAFFLLML